MTQHYLLALLTCTLLIPAWAQRPLGDQARQLPEHVPGRLIIQPLPVADSALVERILALQGAKVHHQIAGIGVSVLEVSEETADAVERALTRAGLFKYVERDFVAHGAATIPDDPDFASQWHLATIQAPSAWSITRGSTGAPIAIIDSGVDSTHPDLASKVLPGWSFLSGNSNTSDVLGHGTAVAGAAAAATNNGTGVAGVSWLNPILPLVVLNSSNYAAYSDIASAIEYAADHGARIINISIGGSSASSTLQAAVDYAWNKGAVIFAAAMNNSSSTPYYPAACTNVLAISATEPNDTLAGFSEYGSWIALSAPGDMILTTTEGGGYGYWYGTSLASPIAAAVGALALSANPSLTSSGLVKLLETNSDDLGTPGFDTSFGWGRVNAYKAVSAAMSAPVSTATPPAVSISSPSSNQVVSGAVSVQGTASDQVAVTKVELDVDGVAAATSGSLPFSFAWNSTSAANGSHALTIKATDANNNVGSASTTVHVSNSTVDTTPPVATIKSPLSGASVSGNVQVQASATDNVKVTKIELEVDGAVVTTANSASLNFNWNSTTTANGSHTLTVKAYDAANNVGSASVTVTVANAVKTPDTTPPTISITAPANGAYLSSNVNITTTAADNVQVKGVSIYIDTVLVKSCGGQCNYSWDISHYTAGSHTITAEAWDAAGNIGYAPPVTVTVK